MSYYICVLDFEATCWPDRRDDNMREIIEFPSILYKVNSVVQKGGTKVEYIGEFQKYVKPVLHPILTDFCTELTGITQDIVDKASTFEQVYLEHYEWLRSYVDINEKLIFATCGRWDLRDMLPIEINRNSKLELYHCYTKYVDIKGEFAKCFGQYCGGMANMLKKLKIKLTGKHHSGIDDCRNLSKIIIKMIEESHKFV